jgi:hypothetical protein
MIGTLLKVTLVTLIVIAITALVGIVIMAGVASTHGVERIDVPEGSFLAATAKSADYADAYRIGMEFASYRDIPRVIENAPIKGDDEVYRGDFEVVYQGEAPGLGYHVAYILDREPVIPTLTMVTTVRIMDRKGRYFWKVFRPIYGCLAPYMLDRLAARATD